MGFGVLMRIQPLLTKHNVELLSVIMASLADSKHPAFNPFWIAFRAQRGDSLADVEQAADLAERLRDILREYLAKEK